jgi:hypothetical protein
MAPQLSQFRCHCWSNLCGFPLESSSSTTAQCMHLIIDYNKRIRNGRFERRAAVTDVVGE